jgi:hypothetical protein
VNGKKLQSSFSKLLSHFSLDVEMFSAKDSKKIQNKILRQKLKPKAKQARCAIFIPSLAMRFFSSEN